MTQDEWKTLCRYAKSNGTYHKLIRAVNAHHNIVNNIQNLTTLNDWIIFFQFDLVKNWYQKYYDDWIKDKY